MKFLLSMPLLLFNYAAIAQNNISITGSNLYQGPVRHFIVNATPAFPIQAHYHDSVIAYIFYGADGRILQQSFTGAGMAYTIGSDFNKVDHVVGDLYKDNQFIRHQFSFQRSGADEWVGKDLVAFKSTTWKEVPVNIVKSDTVTVVEPVTEQRIYYVYQQYQLVAAP